MKKKIIIHITFWLAATTLMLFVFCYAANDKLTTGSYVITGMAILAAGTYTCTQILVPRLLFRKKHFSFAAAFGMVWLTSGSLTFLADYLIIYPALPERSKRYYWDWNNIFYGSYLLVFFFLATMVGLKVLQNWYKIHQRLRDLEQEKIKAELDFLKGQINPHFLFNSINMIFATIDKHNTEARETVVKFAEILRYQLYECSADLIHIEKELQSLKSYFELQRGRKEANFVAELDIADSLKGFQIAPLLLIPIVENAFKHASSHEHTDNIIRVKIDGDHRELRFSSFNTKDREVTREFQHSGGIGMDNIGKRLELLYPGNYQLHVEDLPDRYAVTLSIRIGEAIH